MAESDGDDALLVGEVKWTAPRGVARALLELRQKAERLPFVAGRELFTALWLKTPARGRESGQVFAPRQVLDVLR